MQFRYSWHVKYLLQQHNGKENLQDFVLGLLVS